jgi:uncharacterized protein YndB with AHSA1/START domain
MKQRSVTHRTFVIERSYPTTPQRVFAAFSDPAKKRRWFAGDEDFKPEEFEMDFRVGGRERSSFRAQGVDLHQRYGVPRHRARPPHRDCLYHDPRRSLISSSHATVEFLPTGQGTDLIFTEQAAFFEGADGPHVREEGWRKLLEHLAKELAS